MRKIITLISVIAFALITCGCGDESNSKNSSSSNNMSAEYISERTVQYNKEENIYEILFALSDSDKNFVSASGTAKIKITDAKDNVVYDKEIQFSKKDFTNWTNRMKDTSTYGCWLEIPQDDIDGASSSTGTLSLTVDAGNSTFGETKLSITDLPQKQADIILPEMPHNIIDSRYSSHTSYATISDLTYETENSYDGDMTLILNMTITLNKKIGEEKKADFVAFNYKITDDEGFVADTGTIYSNDLKIGEKTKEEKRIYDLDPSKTYKLVFENAS